MSEIVLIAAVMTIQISAARQRHQHSIEGSVPTSFILREAPVLDDLSLRGHRWHSSQANQQSGVGEESGSLRRIQGAGDAIPDLASPSGPRRSSQAIQTAPAGKVCVSADSRATASAASAKTPITPPVNHPSARQRLGSSDKGSGTRQAAGRVGKRFVEITRRTA